MGKRVVNWINCGAMIVGDVAETVIDEVSGVQIARGTQMLKGKGDAAREPTSVKHIGGEPVMTITTENESVGKEFPPGTRVSVVHATHLSEDNEAAGGAGDIIYSMSNAIVGGGDVSGNYGAWGSIPLEFHGRSVDGIASCLSVAIDT